jgi:electron transport complex protein RnfG
MPASQLEVVKDGATADNQVQAISGATITSKAVTGGCNAAITYFNEVLGGSANE